MSKAPSISKKRKASSAPCEEESLQKTASSPFDNRRGTADLVLRTFDDVDFFVHKEILSIASVAFEELILNPTPNSSNAVRNGLRVVRLTELSNALDSVLRLIYPTPPPNSLELHAIPEILEILRKYELMDFFFRVKPLLVPLIDSEPLCVYAICAEHNLHDLAVMAAVRTLQIPVDSLYSPIFKTLKAHRQLVMYHQKADTSMREFIAGSSWFFVVKGLHKAEDSDSCCPSCYDKRTNINGWIMHKSLRLFILHCKSTPFFYAHLDVTLNYLSELLKLRTKCAYCSLKSSGAVDESGFSQIFQNAVERKLREVSSKFSLCC
jgi:hypothetical protein